MAKKTKALRDLQRGLPPANDVITVKEFLEIWLQESAKPSVRPSTYRSYEQLVRLHIAPEIGSLKLSKLKPQDVQHLINSKLQEGLSPGSVIKLRAVLRRALSIAVRWDLVPRNVATLVDPPAAKRKRVVPLSPEQIRILLQAVAGDRLEALYVLAVSTGMRQGEILGLKWGDIDLDAGVLHVRQAMQNGVHSELKTERSRRTMPLAPFVTAALRAHALRQGQEMQWSSLKPTIPDLVFVSLEGTPIDAANFRRSFGRVLRRGGLPTVRFHDLTHSCASYLLSRGIQPRVIMELLGHSQITLTMDTYSHVMPVLEKEAADAMEALWNTRD